MIFKKDKPDPANATAIQRGGPVYLMGFPRSGTNFLQNVVRNSSKRLINNMYNLEDDPDAHLIIKSHAPSYPHLLGEVGQFAQGISSLPGRFIIIWRDPRDMMISYYEFMKSRFGIEVAQADFLQATTYHRRQPGFEELSIEQAFRLFVSAWHKPNYDVGDGGLQNRVAINLRHEDVTGDPQTWFGRVFEFLGIDCTLAESALKVRTSQHSSVRENRGAVSGWKANADVFGDLIESTESLLGAEIDRLGYRE